MNKDSKSRDLFEKVFPELRSKSEHLRDQAERFNNRSGVRAFGVVRSEAELNELACELMEQEEAKGRYRVTHAVLPGMVIDRSRSSYINTNGLLSDPMAVYRESKSSCLWNDTEKSIFREKFQMFPKNFDKISSHIPNKSVSDCIRYYYHAKKAGNFKSLLRRSGFKRRRHVQKAHEYGLSSHYMLERPKHAPSLTNLHVSTNTASIPITLHNKESVSWSDEEIERLKEALRMYGRAWGRVYRHVGGLKTATQCKQFYDDSSTDAALGLNTALAEHSARKNAERIEKKLAEIQKKPTPPPQPDLESVDSAESDCNTDSEILSERISLHDQNDDTDSETTLTDSGQEDDVMSGDASFSKPKLTPLNLNDPQNDHVPSLQSPLDIFLSAAEALSNTVPSDIALHDHTYSCPPLDIQGGSGLQLIAAAAAVVSPGLSHNTWNASPTSKPSLSHSNAVKAPRGRPPNAQKRNLSNSQKIGPSYLTPTGGSSQSVLLQDFKPGLRGRSRSAPTDKPRPILTNKSPAINSPLLLRSSSTNATKILSTATSCSTTKMSAVSTTAYVRVSKTTDNFTNTSTGIVRGNSCTNPSTVTTNTIIQPKITTNRTKDNSNNNNPAVLELNLGNMALLLAAGSPGNQQATLLLPPSSLFNNKHTLAVIHGGLSNDSNSLTVNNSSFVNAKSSISFDLSKTSTVKNTALPIALPQQNKQQTLKLSLNSPALVKSSHTVQQTSAVPASSVKQQLFTSSVQQSTPTINTPTNDDLSNLNLLSNLVAGLSSTSLTTTTNTQSTPTVNITGNSKITTTWKSDIVKSSLSNSVTCTTSSNNSSGNTSYGTASSHQQSLMLYASSLPINSKSSNVSAVDEEDHLEYATRGIDELSRLLGDSNSTSRSLWSPDELLCNPFSTSVNNATSLSSKGVVPTSHSTYVSLPATGGATHSTT